MKKTTRLAVIDIGSNSVRLVIYDDISRASPTVYNEKVSCKLGKLKSDGTLSKNAKEAVFETLLRYREVCEALNTSKLRIIATAALRDALDGKEFTATLCQTLGLEIEIISGTQEAKLSAKGVLYSLSDANGVVADLGGGSLELVNITKGTPEGGITLPLGILRLQNDVGEVFDKTSYDRHIHTVFEQFLPETMPQADNLYCVGGSWRALAAFYIHYTQHIPNILHGFTVSAVKLGEFIDDILDNPTRFTDIKLPNVSKRRKMSLPVGALILKHVIAYGQFKNIIISVGGVREGVIYDYLTPKQQKSDPALAFVKCENKRSSRNPDLAPLLYDSITPLLGKLTVKEKKLIKLFCYCSDIAWRRHPDYRAEYVFYHLLYCSIPDLNHHERVFLAFAVACRYDHDFKLDEDMIQALDFPKSWQDMAKTIGLAGRYAYTMTAMSVKFMKDLRISKNDKEIITQTGEISLTLGETARKRLELLEKHLFG